MSRDMCPRDKAEELLRFWNVHERDGGLFLQRYDEEQLRAQLAKLLKGKRGKGPAQLAKLLVDKGGQGRAQLAELLQDAACVTCFMGNVTTCGPSSQNVEPGVLVIVCDEEEARFVATLPFFARLRTLRVCDDVLMPLSACTALTSVWLSSENQLLHQRIVIPMELRFRTLEVAIMLRELPALRALHMGIVWDPSVIVKFCSRSLVSLQCQTCAVLEAPMPNLQRFVCSGQFACLMERGADVSTVLRCCTALRTVFIASAWEGWPLFTAMLALPQLKEAILPLGSCHEVPEDKVGTSVTRGMVYRVLGTTPARLLLLPVLAYLLRVRVLSRVARVAGFGTGSLHWVVFKAPTPLFIPIWKALHDMSVVTGTQSASNWRYEVR